MSKPEYDVVVVGAGLSGLATCDELVKRKPGLRICLLEARGRVGGRTETACEYNVDVGAQWIGSTHIEMLSLAERFKVKLLEQFYPAAQTTRLTECVGFSSSPLLAHVAEGVCKYIELIETLSEEIEPNAPWSHPSADIWDMMSVTKHVEAHVASKDERNEILLFAQTVLACCPESTSFLFFLFYVRSGGGMQALGDGDSGAQKWKVEGGMQQISTKLAHQLETKDGIAVRLNAPVKSVSWDSDNITIVFQDDDSTGSITCSRLVFALSPQLISSQIEFVPSLPQERIALGRELIAGHTVKVVVGYDNPFWLNSENSCAVNASTQHRDSPVNAHFTELGPVRNLFHAQFSCHENKKEIPALVGLITGQAALQVAKIEDEQARKKIVLDQFVRMYGSEDTESKVRQPVFYLDKVWAKDSFAQGCFAGIAPANGCMVRLGRWLRKPVGPFHFASTETATEFYGYMEGAVRAGRRAAIEVLGSFPAVRAHERECGRESAETRLGSKVN